MKKKIKYLIPSIITIIMVLIIYYLNQLYPFANNSIVQVDADYQYIPVLFRIYDFIHLKSGILYSDIGLGNSIYTSMIIQGSIFSPLTLLLYFTKRSNIPYFFNILVMIKMALISLTSYIYFKKKYKVEEFYLILFSIIYTFSGWVILNYFNIMWLDCVILFPLIMLYLDELINDKKYVGYVITLALSLSISYYISLFILIFIFIYSFLNIFILKKQEERKQIIFLLGKSTINAIIISSFSLIPALYHTFNSSRLSWGGSYPMFNHTINKIIYLMGMSLPLIFIILLNIKNKDDPKKMFVYRMLIILYTINIIFEPINMAMHFGSYWSFPFRYSFITLFILVNASLYYLTKYPIKSSKIRAIPIFLTIILFVFAVYFNNLYFKDIRAGQVTLDFNKWEIFKYMLIMLITFIVMKIFTLLIENKILVKVFLVITTLIEIFIITSWTMYYNSGYYLVKEANEANNTLHFDNDYFKRYKIDYPYYSIDYGFMMNVNTLDNWLHILPKGMTNHYKQLGYLVNDSSIKAQGGTIFTDNLLNMNYIITKNYLDRSMYKPLQVIGQYKLYKYNTQLPYGIVYDSSRIIINNEEHGFNLHNNIYQSLFNKKDELIQIKTFYNDGNQCLNISDTINEDSYIYLDMSSNGKKVNDIIVNKRTFYNSDNYIRYFGIYNGELDIQVCAKENEYIDFLDLGIINVSKYLDFIKSVESDVKVNYHNGYNIKASTYDDNKSLFLPINNIKGLDVRNNGHKIKANHYLDNFVSIKLSKGENNISIKYHEPYLLLSIILSIVGIILLILSKHININNKYVLSITYYVYIIMALFIYFYFYVYSFIKK